MATSPETAVTLEPPIVIGFVVEPSVMTVVVVPRNFMTDEIPRSDAVMLTVVLPLWFAVKVPLLVPLAWIVSVPLLTVGIVGLLPCPSRISRLSPGGAWRAWWTGG